MAPPGNSSQSGDLRFNATLQDNVSPQVDTIVRKMQQLGASKHEIKIFIRAYDDATQRATQVKQHLATIPKEVRTQIVVETAHAHRAINEIKKLAATPIHVAIKLKDATEQDIVKARNYFNRIKQEAVTSFQTMPALGDAMKFTHTMGNMGLSVAGLGGAGLVAGGAAFARQSFQQNAQLEQDTISLKATLKNMGEAMQEMSNVTQFARKTPFNQPDVLQSDIMMRNFGINPRGPAGLTTAGNMAAAFGRPQQEATLAIADAAKRGDFRMMSGFGLNMQQSDFGPGGRYQGMSVQEAIGLATKQRFGTAMQEQAHTFRGLTSNIQDVGNISFTRPAGATGFGAVKSVEQNLEKNLTGQGPSAIQFQKEMGKVVQSINDMSSKMLTAFKTAGDYFKTYLQKPLMGITSNLTEFGGAFAKTFGATAVTILKTFGEAFTSIAKPMSQVANWQVPAWIPAIGGLNAAKVEAFGKALHYMGFQKTAQPFEDFPKDLATMHPLKAAGDIFKMGAQLPKLALLNIAKNILDDKAATDALNDSFEHFGKGAGDALDNVKLKLDLLSVSTGKKASELRGLGAEVANLLPTHTPNISDVVARGVNDIQGAQDKYGGNIKGIIERQVQQWAQTQDISGKDWDKATMNATQAANSVADSLGVTLKTAVDDLANSFNVFSKQIGESKGSYGRNSAAAASVLTQMEGLVKPGDLTSKLIGGRTMLGTVQNPQQLSAAIYDQWTHPSIRGLQKLYQNPGYSVESTQTFRKDFDVWNGKFNQAGRRITTAPGQMLRHQFLDATETEQARVDQLGAYDRRASRATGGLDIKLPHPEDQFFKYDVGIHANRMKDPDSMAKEMIRFQDVIKKVQQASEDAQTAFATLQVAQQHLSQSQTEVNFKFENFQHSIAVNYQRKIEDMTLAMNQFSFDALRPIQREMTRLQNSMEVYQHTAIVPVQRAQEDWNHVMQQTSYHLDDVSFKTSQASFQMDKYSSGLLTGEHALNEQIFALDQYQKKLQLIKLSNMGMMADLTKTTFTEGFKMTVKPMMGFSLARAEQVAGIKADRARLEKETTIDAERHVIELAQRSKFQRTERSPEEILNHVTAARKILDEGVESTHKLSIIQHAQSVHARIFTEKMYEATVGMRDFEDAQYNLSQKMFPLNEQLADMQDNITGLSLAMEKRSLHARVYQDALDKLRHSSYHLGRDLYEAEQRVNQLDALLPIARGQQGLIYDHFLKGITDMKFDQLKELIHQLGEAGELPAGIVKSYESMKDPMKAAAQKMKSDIHQAFDAGVSGFLGLFTLRTELLLGHMTSNFAQSLSRSIGVTLPDVVTNALTAGTAAYTTVFAANAARIGIGRTLVPGALGAAAHMGPEITKKPIERLAGWAKEGVPLTTLTRPSAYLGSRSVDVLGAMAFSSMLGPALGIPTGLLAGYGYEKMGGGAFGAGGRGVLKHLPGAGRLFSALPDEIMGPGRIRAFEKRVGTDFVPDWMRSIGIGINPAEPFEKHLTTLSKLRGKETGPAKDVLKYMDDVEKRFASAGTTASRFFKNTADTIETLLGPNTRLGTQVGKGRASATALLERFRGEGGALDVAEFGPISKMLRAGIAGSEGIGAAARFGVKGIGKLAWPAAIALSAKGGIDAGRQGVGLAGSELAYAEGLDPTSLVGLIPGLHNFHGVIGTAGRALGIDTRTGAEKFIGSKVAPYLKNLQGNLKRLGSETVDQDTGRALSGMDINRRQQAEVGTLLTRIGYAEKQKGYHGELDDTKKQLRELSDSLDTAYGNMQSSAKAFHKRQHHAHKVYAHGLADIETGIRTHNEKQTEKGYKEVSRITGMKLKDIKTMVKHMGDETGKEYAHALNLAIQRVISGPPGKESDLYGSTAQSEAVMKHLRKTARFGDGNAYLAEINRLFPEKNEKESSTPKLKDKFKAIEESTDTHLVKMKSFYDTFHQDRKKGDETYWKDAFTRRTGGMNAENTDLDRHGSNVFKKVSAVYDPHTGKIPKTYYAGWQHVDQITSSWLGRIDKKIEGIDHTLNTTADNKAHGGVVDGKNIGKGHLIRVGEEGFPEVVIPLAPHRRDRAVSLMKQTHGFLGVPKYAHGGITDFAGHKPYLASGYKSGGPDVDYAGIGFNAVNAFTKKKFHGLGLTTGMLTHQIFAGSSGNTVSDHTKGLAGDFSNGTPGADPNKQAMWNFFQGKIPQVIKQMIYKNQMTSHGGIANYGLMDHFNHVHLAMDEPYAFNAKRIAKILARASRGISFKDLLRTGGGGDETLARVPKGLRHLFPAGDKLYKALQHARSRWQENIDQDFGSDSSRVKIGGGVGEPGSGRVGEEFFRLWANRAARRFHIDPSILFGIGQIETGFGANRGPSSAGAVGLMQFMPATAAGLGINPYDDGQAILGAAKYLSQGGGMKNLYKAVFGYNHSDAYVRDVLSASRGYKRFDRPFMKEKWYKDYAGGGFAGWFGEGGAFTANRPTLFGAGEKGPERVSITPAGQGDLWAKIETNTRTTAVHTLRTANATEKQTGGVQAPDPVKRAAGWRSTKLGTDLFKDEQSHLAQMRIHGGMGFSNPWDRLNPTKHKSWQPADYSSYKREAMDRGVPLDTIKAVIKAAKTTTFDTLTSDKQVPATLGILANILNRAGATSPHLVGRKGFKTKYESTRTDPGLLASIRSQKGVTHNDPAVKAANETTKAVNRNTQEVRRNRPYAPSRATEALLNQAQKDAAQAASDSKKLHEAARVANADLAKLSKASAISHADRGKLKDLLTSGNLTRKEVAAAGNALKLTNKAIREEAKARHDTLKALHVTHKAQHLTDKASHELHRGAALARKASHDLSVAKYKAQLDGHTTAKEHRKIADLHKTLHEAHKLLHKGHVDEAKAHHVTSKALHDTTKAHKETTKALKDASEAHHATTKVIRDHEQRIEAHTSETRDAVDRHHSTHKDHHNTHKLHHQTAKDHHDTHKDHRDNVHKPHLRSAQDLYTLSAKERAAIVQTTVQQAAQISSGPSGTIAQYTPQQQTDLMNLKAALEQSAKNVAQGLPPLPGTPGGRPITAQEWAYIGGSHAMGLRYVPYDNYRAKLHVGERVLTKQEAKAYNYNESGTSMSTSAMENLLARVVTQLNELKQNQGDITVVNNAQGASLSTNVIRLPSRTR